MTTYTSAAIYDEWQDGDVTDLQAIRALCMELGEVESELSPLQKQRETLRARISTIVERVGAIEIDGFGRLLITDPTIVKAFDKAKIQTLISELVEDYPDIAARLMACETKSQRIGGLRIEREK